MPMHVDAPGASPRRHLRAGPPGILLHLENMPSV